MFVKFCVFAFVTFIVTTIAMKIASLTSGTNSKAGPLSAVLFLILGFSICLTYILFDSGIIYIS